MIPGAAEEEALTTLHKDVGVMLELWKRRERKKGRKITKEGKERERKKNNDVCLGHVRQKRRKRTKEGKETERKKKERNCNGK